MECIRAVLTNVAVTGRPSGCGISGPASRSSGPTPIKSLLLRKPRNASYRKSLRDALVRMLLQTQVCRGFICSVHRPLARKGLAINQISWFVNVSTPRVRFLMTANSRQLVSGSIYDTGRVMLTGVRRQNLRSRVKFPLIGLSYPPMTNRSRSLMERLG
jgi:hypothetical protein